MPADPSRALLAASSSPGAMTNRSAARETFLIPELRQEIFRSLDTADLARCLRICKVAMVAAARVLYREVTYDVVQDVIGNVTKYQHIYLESVIAINARPLRPSPEVLDQLQDEYPNLPYYRAHGTPDVVEVLFIRYNPILFQTIVPPLKSQCPNVRQILLGSEYGPHGLDSWAVHLDTTRAEADTAIPASGVPLNLSGHIQLVRNLQLHPLSEPPSRDYYPLPVAPSSHFPLRYRINLDFESLPENNMDGSLVARWDAAMREGPLFANMYKAIDIDKVPLPLDLFTAMYERQKLAGYGPDERLSDIIAPRAPWSMADFRIFARAASSSLSVLVLTDDWSAASEDRVTHVAFADLPTLLPIIKTELPNLRELSLCLSGIATAEAFLGDLLHDGSLEDGGTVGNLSITTTPADTQLFNTIRYLCQLCTSDAEICINTGNDAMWGKVVQTALLQYLREQPHAHRARLATVNFASLGITNPQTVSELSYDLDGKPKRAVEGKVARWAELAWASRDAATGSQIPKLLQRLAGCTETMDRVAGRAAGLDDEELLVDAEEALAAAEQARAAAEEIVGMSVAQVNEMRRYVNDLKIVLGHS